ncbi:hypothetical protein D3C80_1551130 [compost metagenome]
MLAGAQQDRQALANVQHPHLGLAMARPLRLGKEQWQQQNPAQAAQWHTGRQEQQHSAQRHQQPGPER